MKVQLNLKIRAQPDNATCGPTCLHALYGGHPILTGLSATYLYHCPREYGPRCDYDDIRGEPMGHFVVLSGYDRMERTVMIADPLRPIRCPIRVIMRRPSTGWWVPSCWGF